MVDLCERCNRTPWTGIAYPLLDSYCRRQARDHIDLRFLEDFHILACIGGEAVKISALAFGKEDIKGKGGFSRARYTGQNNQLLPWNREVEVLEVVLPGAPYSNCPRYTCHRCGCGFEEFQVTFRSA